MKTVIANQDAVASLTVAGLDQISVVKGMIFHLDLGNTADGPLMNFRW